MFEKQGGSHNEQSLKPLMISVPTYLRVLDKEDDKYIVKYNVRFSDLENGYFFDLTYRYSQLKSFHESLSTTKCKELPDFPKTSWFFRVNDDVNRVEERRKQLDTYFQNLMGIKVIRDSYLLKNFIKDAKIERDRKNLKNAHSKDQKIPQDQQKKQELNTELLDKPQELQQKQVGAKIKKARITNQFQTPAIVAAKPPADDSRERARSFEELEVDDPKDKKPATKSKADQLKQVTIGGRCMYKGLLQKK